MNSNWLDVKHAQSNLMSKILENFMVSTQGLECWCLDYQVLP